VLLLCLLSCVQLFCGAVTLVSCSSCSLLSLEASIQLESPSTGCLPQPADLLVDSNIQCHQCNFNGNFLFVSFVMKTSRNSCQVVLHLWSPPIYVVACEGQWFFCFCTDQNDSSMTSPPHDPCALQNKPCQDKCYKNVIHPSWLCW